MLEKLSRGVKSMEMEDQILHIGVVVCALGILLPWFTEQPYSTTNTWSGFRYYTAYLGTAVFLMQLIILLTTALPMVGGPVFVRKSSRNYFRLVLSSLSLVLLGSSFTVLLQVTNNVSGTDIRFGLIVSIIGGAVAALYSLLKYQQQLKTQTQELFHHPEESVLRRPHPLREPEEPPPPPPPPPPLPVEEHHLVGHH